MLNQVTYVTALLRILANGAQPARGPGCLKMFYMSPGSTGMDAKN